jgi:PAS domain S-box-containing protein
LTEEMVVASSGDPVPGGDRRTGAHTRSAGTAPASAGWGFTFADAAQLAESLPDGILVADEVGTIRFVNRRLTELTGYTDAELVGAPVEKLVPRTYRVQHQEHRARFVSTPSVRTMGGHLDIRAVRADGTELDVDIALSTLESTGGRLVVASVRDATDRKALERARHESEERFHLLVDTVRDYAIFILDPSGKVATWNAGAERLKGYTADEILGQHYSIFHTPEDVEAGKPAALLREAVISGRVEETAWRVRKDGSRFQATVTITALRDSAGALRGFAKITRDVTEVQRARDDLERLRLLEQREQLGRDLHDGAIQSIFAVGMRLQSILSLSRDPEVAARIDTAIIELDDAIKEVRAFIFQLGQARSVDALGAEVRRLCTDHQARTGMTTIVSIDGDALRQLQPHASAVLLITKEALSNVARHAGASTARVTIRGDTGRTILEIDDDGRGFDVGGTTAGLGIANARARARSAGGQYEVESGAGGTTVRLTIPSTPVG